MHWDAVCVHYGGLGCIAGSVHHLLVHLVHPLLALSASASAIHHTDHPHQVNQKRCHYM